MFVKLGIFKKTLSRDYTKCIQLSDPARLGSTMVGEEMSGDRSCQATPVVSTGLFWTASNGDCTLTSGLLMGPALSLPGFDINVFHR